MMNTSTVSLNFKNDSFILWMVVMIGVLFSCDQKELMDKDHFLDHGYEISDMQETSQDLYQATSQDYKDENFVISPLSIQLALYMVYNGADGDTKEEIGELLRVMDGTTNWDLERLNKRTKSLLRYFNGLVRDGHLDIHNALFYDDSRVALAEDFVNRLETYFDVHKAELDFGSSKAVESINEWVSNKTYDKIKEVIQDISDQEVLFLINALYLKADWVTGFQEQATSDRKFVTARGEEITIPTMHRTGAVDHLNISGTQVVKLPLADSSLYTYLIMPQNPDELSDLIKSPMITEIWNQSLGFKNARVVLEMPVIETKTHLPLNQALQSLGMTSAFDPGKADLGFMGESKVGPSLFVSRTLHDVYLKMDEKGVEGAAVTTIGVGTTSIPPAIQFNKPFLYLIVDHEKGLPLFIGQFTGVTKEN